MRCARHAKTHARDRGRARQPGTSARTTDRSAALEAAAGTRNQTCLCQVKSAGFAAQCATLQLAWELSTPDLVAVRVEMPTLTSVLEVAANVDGAIRRYGAEVPVTDIDYDKGLKMAAGCGLQQCKCIRVACGGSPVFNLQRRQRYLARTWYAWQRRPRLLAESKDEGCACGRVETVSEEDRRSAGRLGWECE